MRRDATWYDTTLHNMSWPDNTLYVMTLMYNVWCTTYDMQRHDMTWHDMIIYAMNWHDTNWTDMTWHDLTWPDMTWHDKQYHTISCPNLPFSDLRRPTSAAGRTPRVLFSDQLPRARDMSCVSTMSSNRFQCQTIDARRSNTHPYGDTACEHITTCSLPMVATLSMPLATEHAMTCHILA